MSKRARAKDAKTDRPWPQQSDFLEIHGDIVRLRTTVENLGITQEEKAVVLKQIQVAEDLLARMMHRAAKVTKLPPA